MNVPGSYRPPPFWFPHSQDSFFQLVWVVNHQNNKSKESVLKAATRPLLHHESHVRFTIFFTNSCLCHILCISFISNLFYCCFRCAFRHLNLWRYLFLIHRCNCAVLIMCRDVSARWGQWKRPPLHRNPAELLWGLLPWCFRTDLLLLTCLMRRLNSDLMGRLWGWYLLLWTWWRTVGLSSVLGWPAVCVLPWIQTLRTALPCRPCVKLNWCLVLVVIQLSGQF